MFKQLQGSRCVKTFATCSSFGGLMLSLVLCLLFVSQAKAALYIGTGNIARANLDGSLFEEGFVKSDGGSFCSIAVNSSHIFWTDDSDNSIGRANLDGTGVEHAFIRLGDGAVPCGLALDSQYIYWSNQGTDTIGRARLNGSEVDQSFISTVQHPCAVAVDSTKIYWASDDENQIWRTDIAGANAPELVANEHALDPCGLALSSSHLFWVESDAGTIVRANLDGSEAEPEFITGGRYPVSLALHGGRLYWVNNAWDAMSVGSADVDGNNVNQSLLSGLSYPYALAVDSVPVVSRPRPPAPPPANSSFKLGKLRRHKDGSVFFPLNLYGDGWLEARVVGAALKVQGLQPEGAAGRIWLNAGRKWLKITPTTKRGSGSRCVLRAFRRGWKVRLALRLRFTEPGKLLHAKTQPFLFFKPRQSRAATSKHRRPVISCPA